MASPIRIAVLDDFQNVSQNFGDWAALRTAAEVTVFNDHIDDEDDLFVRLQPFDAICIMRERTRFPASLLRRLPKLRLIASTGEWNAAIDMPVAAELGIVVSGTSASCSMIAAAELTWTLIMAAARHIPTELDSFRAGGWQRTVGCDLHGQTLGIIGLGNTGSRVAKYAQAFGMRVIAWSHYLTPEIAREHGVAFVTKDELFRSSNFLSLHVRLSERTREMIGARELGLMNGNAWLVNTARGQIVDESALIDALVRRQIAGAALDVYGVEPLPLDHPFRRLPNVIATSHIGYVTHASYEQFYGEMASKVLAWIRETSINRALHDGVA